MSDFPDRFHAMIPTPHDRSLAIFPLWIERSGLPMALFEAARTANAWGVFRLIVELDMAANPRRPGLVEVAVADLGEWSATEPARIEKAVKAMRKLALVRAFLPEHEGESALFQVLTPLPTPHSADEVRARNPDLFLEADWPPRYAVALPEEDDAAGEAESREKKIRRVVDLYLDTFSMKMNALILDELQLIASRYELALIEKVFFRARKHDARSLGWILSEIRREMRQRTEAGGKKPLGTG